MNDSIVKTLGVAFAICLICSLVVSSTAVKKGMMLAILFANLLAPVIDHMVMMSNINRRKALTQ